MIKRRTLSSTTPPNSALIPLRGPSGRLYGMLDREKLTIEVKRKNEPAETIDLRPLFTGDAMTRSALDIVQNAIDRVGREVIASVDVPLRFGPSPFDGALVCDPRSLASLTFFGYPVRVDPSLAAGEMRLVGADGVVLHVVNLD